MKKLIRIVLMIFGLLILLVIGGLAYVKFALPNVGKAPDISIQSTPAMLERGKYLAHHVAVCIDCHSERDWTKFSGPPKESSYGQGGEIFDQKMGFPGAYYAKNITPAGIGEWTDGEVFRAITSGVSKDGSPLFPIMPHPNYGQTSQEDMYSIIAYLRTLKPIQNKVKKASSDFPMNFIIHLIPQKPNLKPIPSKKDGVAYGKYLITMASCGDCHTKQVKGAKVEGMDYAGGFEFPLPDIGTLRSSNITPDKETGIGGWTKEQFVERFKVYASQNYTPKSVAKGDFNSIMPWTMYADMTEEDLGAIYDYLRTVKPVKNKVIKLSK
jgi:hypothetical protein